MLYLMIYTSSLYVEINETKILLVPCYYTTYSTQAKFACLEQNMEQEG